MSLHRWVKAPLVVPFGVKRQRRRRAPSDPSRWLLLAPSPKAIDVGPVCCLWGFRRGFRSSPSQHRSPPDVVCSVAGHNPWRFAKPLPDQCLPRALPGGLPGSGDQPSTLTPITLVSVPPSLYGPHRTVGRGPCRPPSPSRLRPSLAVIASITLCLLTVCAWVNRSTRTRCLDKETFPRREVALIGGFVMN